MLSPTRGRDRPTPLPAMDWVAQASRTCSLCAAIGFIALTLCSPHASCADIDPNSGIDFVTIRAAGNSPWPGASPPIPGDRAVGRGSVNYEYRIGRFEVTTAQWVEFFNAAYDRPAGDSIPYLFPPDTWGAVQTTPINPGGRRWRVPAGREMWGVGDIGWRMAAVYCNWLHNNKSNARSAFLGGAYDISTFGSVPGSPGIFSDQATRSPGARYFIPTWDEWLKAAHYGPQKPNADGTRGGWWLYSTTSDTAPRPGPPPSMLPGSPGQVNAGGVDFMGISPFAIPLGAYTGVTSPWGLYEVAGGTMEWTEEILTDVTGVRYRVLDGSWWVDGSAGVDLVGYPAADDFPNVAIFDRGLRIASAIPSPGSVSLLVCAGAVAVLGRQRRVSHETFTSRTRVRAGNGQLGALAGRRGVQRRATGTR